MPNPPGGPEKDEKAKDTEYPPTVNCCTFQSMSEDVLVLTFVANELISI